MLPSNSAIIYLTEEKRMLTGKLTQTYGKYHLAMLHRELFMSERNSSCQQTRQMADNISSTTSAV